MGHYYRKIIELNGGCSQPWNTSATFFWVVPRTKQHLQQGCCQARNYHAHAPRHGFVPRQINHAPIALTKCWSVAKRLFFSIANSFQVLQVSWRYFPPGIATKILDSVLALALSGLKIAEWSVKIPMHYLHPPIPATVSKFGLISLSGKVHFRDIKRDFLANSCKLYSSCWLSSPSPTHPSWTPLLRN